MPASHGQHWISPTVGELVPQPINHGQQIVSEVAALRPAVHALPQPGGGEPAVAVLAPVLLLAVLLVRARSRRPGGVRRS